MSHMSLSIASYANAMVQALKRDTKGAILRIQCDTWTAPPLGTIKFNFDVAFKDHKGAIVRVERNCGGMILEAGGKKIVAFYVNIAEAGAALECVSIITKSLYKLLWLEGTISI